MDAISKYLQKVKTILARGNATEHSYRPALIDLIESSAKNIKATNEPKRAAAGAPDLIVTRDQIPLGYIETKDIGIDLDKEERSEQLKRYLGGLSNLILTDYLEFRWYVNGEKRMSVQLAAINNKGRFAIAERGLEELPGLLDQFYSTKIPTVTSPKELAARMARLAQLIRDIILKALAGEDIASSLHEQLTGFRKVLLHDLESEQFADMYAQTICYGLFAARCNHQGSKPFTREFATLELPETNPFLAEMFDHIAGRRLEKSLTWIVDHLAELLNRADIAGILRDFGKRTRREDPVVHFYETFLAAYDPKMREARGVYYTPEPVVSYIVRSIDHILKTDFGLPDGLADTSKVKFFKNVEGKDGKVKREDAGECHKVLILDPAVGTGTFLYGVIDQIHEQVLSKGGKGMWSGYVSKHLLPRLFGFEILMAPYAVAHMKLGLQLKESGYDFNSGERLKIYLTNTLEESQQLSGLDFFASRIAAEANAASSVKSEAPVMVILGNPPYSGHSANKGEWIAGLLRGKDTLTARPTENYFEIDGNPLDERNPKWLNDDYVKFIRFGQWRIEQTGYGIMAMITNHGYLDNPTFRGMRQSLMKTFDQIYIIDLHGNAKKRETCPDGSKDENVFDIQQGVAIGIFVKRPGTKDKNTFRHAQCYGLREDKYRWLWENQVISTEWSNLKPDAPLYFFIPQNKRIWKEYETGYKLTDIMPINSVGVVTARDSLTIHWDKDTLWKTVNDFCKLPPEDARAKFHLGEDARDWKVELAQKDLRESGPNKSRIQKILYRPFDFRFTYYTGKSRGFICMPRQEVMKNLLQKNLALLAPKRIETLKPWQNVLCSLAISEHVAVSLKTIDYCFPLYLYKNIETQKSLGLHSSDENDGGVGPNINASFIKSVTQNTLLSFINIGKGDLKTTFGPEDIFHYMYAVFHSPAYRKRYAEFLKIDFPRLPITSNKRLFKSLCILGEELVNLHLMEKHGPSIAKYPIPDGNLVEKVRYTAPGQGAKCGRVWINKEQYFDNVPPDVWQFHIGGYQVCEKWLKDRKGRKLSYDDLEHYQHIISALSETIRIMAEIDSVIEKNGGWPIT